MVEHNKKTLPTLTTWARLEEGTILQVSHFGVVDWETYCHWSFPDDSVENSCPSYMMARKLNRRNVKNEPENRDPFIR